MANFDRFSVVVNWQYYGANYQNIVHVQVTNETNADTVMENAGTVVLGKFVIPYLANTTNQLKCTTLVVRRLAPAIADVFTLLSDTDGSKNEFGLPGTNFYLLRYRGRPYEQGKTYHWKLPGVGRPGNNAGNVTDGKLTDLAALITAIVGDPTTVNGNTFTLTVPHKRDDPVGVARPVIGQAFVDGKVRNLRSRQVY